MLQQSYSKGSPEMNSLHPIDLIPAPFWRLPAIRQFFSLQPALAKNIINGHSSERFRIT
jgi:hypothetical protein